MKICLIFAIVLATSACCLALSIESGAPVKVTHRNSGPRYDIDDNDSPSVTPSRAAPKVVEANTVEGERDVVTSGSVEQPSEQDQIIPMRHVSIRRIFLVPIMRPPRPDWMDAPGANGNVGEDSVAESSPRPSDQEPDHHHEQAPSMKFTPLFPFLTPNRLFGSPHKPATEDEHVRRPHLFGADEASRSPSDKRVVNDERGERENMDGPIAAGPHAMIDPIQMMLDLMHQAVSGQLTPPKLGDENGAATTTTQAAASEERPQSPRGVEKSLVKSDKAPSVHNETREDIVEIEGKKYLRKTIFNRHVGDNIIFMTRRLVFTPLNETNESSETSTTAPTTTTESITTELPKIETDKKGPVEESAPSTTTTTTTTTTAATTTTTTTANEAQTTTSEPSPTSSSATNEQLEQAAKTTASPTTTTTTSAVNADATEATTTKPESWVESIEGAVDKAAERLVEAAKEQIAGSTTEKPSQ